jgi:putative addiction module component (TIGR02574 family)
MLDISRLSPKERLDLIGALWDSLTAKDVLPRRNARSIGAS